MLCFASQVGEKHAYRGHSRSRLGGDEHEELYPVLRGEQVKGLVPLSRHGSPAAIGTDSYDWLEVVNDGVTM